MARRYTAEQVIEALKTTKGMVYLAAKLLKCAPKTVYAYIKDYPTIKSAWEQQNGEVGDVAEMALYDAILNKEHWAIAFYLSTKGKSRGYAKRSEMEVSGKDGEAMTIRVIGGIDLDKDI